MKFVPGVIPPTTTHSAQWLLFRDQQILVKISSSAKATFPTSAEVDKLDYEPATLDYIGSYGEDAYYLAELTADLTIPDGYELRGLRQLFGELEEDRFWIAGRALHIRQWDQNHRYCGSCGSLTKRKEDERAKLCPECGAITFPRISPAIIVAITKGDQILLATSVRFAGQFYSVLAGFVEPGENLEECVRREVMEEVGIEVKNIRYFNSQPWPFPDSLMIGFTAEYAGGEIKIDPKEIAHADWYSVDQLPNIPGKMSIARSLIDWFIEENTK